MIYNTHPEPEADCGNWQSSHKPCVCLCALSPPPSPPPECDNTCVFGSDGDCDDGGPGSNYDFCLLGTDCTDCGSRAPSPPLPSRPPPLPSRPPTPPSPPTPPPQFLTAEILISWGFSPPCKTKYRDHVPGTYSDNTCGQYADYSVVTNATDCPRAVGDHLGVYGDCTWNDGACVMESDHTACTPADIFADFCITTCAQCRGIATSLDKTYDDYFQVCTNDSTFIVCGAMPGTPDTTLVEPSELNVYHSTWASPANVDNMVGDTCFYFPHFR